MTTEQEIQRLTAAAKSIADRAMMISAFRQIDVFEWWQSVEDWSDIKIREPIRIAPDGRPTIRVSCNPEAPDELDYWGSLRAFLRYELRMAGFPDVHVVLIR